MICFLSKETMESHERPFPHRGKGRFVVEPSTGVVFINQPPPLSNNARNQASLTAKVGHPICSID